MKENSTPFERTACVFIVAYNAYPLHRSPKFCLQYFRKLPSSVEFLIVFGVNDSKYQNILPTISFANSPR